MGTLGAQKGPWGCGGWVDNTGRHWEEGVRSRCGFGDIGEVTEGTLGMGWREWGHWGHRGGHGNVGVGVEMEHWDIGVGGGTLKAPAMQHGVMHSDHGVMCSFFCCFMAVWEL